MCCLDLFIGHKGNCNQIENLINNCTDYDINEKECSHCIDGYHEYHGVCC